MKTKGRTCMITKKGMTFGSTGTLVEFKESINKWKIKFDGAWVGWYSESEFQVMGAMESMSHSY